MLRRSVSLLTFLLALVCTSAAAESGAVFATPKKLDTDGFQDVFAQVADNVYIAGQPSPAGLERVRELGVGTVVNLRTNFEMDNRSMVPFDEASTVREMGINYVHVPLGGPGTPYTPAAVEALGEAISNAEGKVLLHCTVAFRATHLWTAYLIAEQGMAFDEAIGVARQLNLGGIPLEGFLDKPLTIVPVQEQVNR